MKDTKLHLFITKNLLDKRDASKIEKSLCEILKPEDFSYMATINKSDVDIWICTFEPDKIRLIEKRLEEFNVIVESKDITEQTLNFNYPKELEYIINDNYDNKFIIERFIVRNLDIDKILDKICDHGMESLNRLERKFLKRLDNI